MSKNKKKYIVIGIIAVIIIGTIIYFSPRSTNHLHNNTTIDNSYDENFGSNNDVITEPAETEAVTANQNNNNIITEPTETEVPTAAKVEDIEIVYNDVLYDGFGKKRGAIKIDNCTVVNNIRLNRYDVYIDFEKIMESSVHNGNFAIKMYVYDANGTPIENKQICYVSNFANDEVGKKYKDETYISQYDSAAKIEFIGG